MNRYTTKHFWRMKESDEGEWVRYEEYQQLIEDYDKTNKFNHVFIAKLYANARKYSRHLELRLLVLFSLVMGIATYTIIDLILWSLGL